MQFAIPLFEKRVAPRCTIADSILILKVSQNIIASRKEIQIPETNWLSLLNILAGLEVDTIVCGGINRQDKHIAHSNGISIIENVACSVEDILKAIEAKGLKSGYGFSYGDLSAESRGQINQERNFNEGFNCLSCLSKECESGEPCPYINGYKPNGPNEELGPMLETTIDISMEEERKLCRLTELVYYAIEMKYKKIGIAYCSEMAEPTEILTSVLKRFFEVYPINCKINGKKLEDNPSGKTKIACNPIGQAEILNGLNSDLNIIVGLCIGADCLFSKASNAPVTALFVKDKSLANNPIGALYSDYYLKEAANSALK